MPRQKINLSLEEITNAATECNTWQEVADVLGIGIDILRRERKRHMLPNTFSEIKMRILREIPLNYLDDILPLETKEGLELNHVLIEVDEDIEYVHIIPFGDIHWGHSKCDKRTLRVVLDWMYKMKNVFVITMGDLVESSVLGSPGLFDQEKFLDAQVYDVVKMLKPLADEGRIIGMHVGNHERRVIKGTSFNITKLMCEMLDVKYLGDGMIHLIEVTNGKNTQFYTFYTTHGASGAMYPHTKMTACMRLEKIAKSEVYCMGHVHSLGHQKMDTYEVDLVNKVPIKKPRHYVLTGSFLKYWGSYAQAKGLVPGGDSGSPKIKLHINSHRISVSL